MKRDIFDLRAMAQARGGADYRAADLTPVNDVATPEPIVVTSILECDCGNLLTVEDRGDKCRQCYLRDSWTTPRKITFNDGRGTEMEIN